MGEQERKLADEEHTQRLRYEQERAEVELANERARNAELVQREREKAEIDLANVKARREEELKKMEGLKQLGVDLNPYLCALASVKPDQHLKIDANGPNPPTLHLELPRSRNGEM